jgi:hypothetical protein
MTNIATPLAQSDRSGVLLAAPPIGHNAAKMAQHSLSALPNLLPDAFNILRQQHQLVITSNWKRSLRPSDI